MDNDDQARFQVEVMEARAQAALEALREARKHGTPDEALMILAYEAGVAKDFYKEIRR